MKRRWTLRGNRDFIFSTDTAGLFSVKPTSDGYAYVVANRSSSNFTKKPLQSSVDFIAGQRLVVRATLDISGSTSASWVLVSYGPQGIEKAFGDASGVSLFITPGTTRVSLALRVSGSGTVRVTSLEESNHIVHSTHPVSAAHSTASDFRKEFQMVPGQQYDLSISYTCKDPASAGTALVLFRYADSRGQFLVSPDDMAINPRFGSYVEASLADEKQDGRIATRITAPRHAEKLIITARDWKKGTSIRFDPAVECDPIAADIASVVTDPASSILEFVGKIPEKEQVIVLHTTAPQLGHPTLALRPNRLAKEFAELGKWVIFLPFSRVDGGFEQVNARTIQLSPEFMPTLLDGLIKRKGRQNVFVCSSYPDIKALTAFDLLKLRDWTLIYEVRDDMEEFNRVGYSKWFSPILEQEVARRSDKILTVSPRLAAKMDILTGEQRSVVIGNGVSRELTDGGKPLRTPEGYAYRESQGKVGYIGHLTPSWFDWATVIQAARELPQVDFEIIGHGKPEKLELPANVLFHGPKSHAEYIEISKSWKVGLIPFIPSTLTYAVDPNKLYEYLAVGMRVVTADMGAVRLAPMTHVYADTAEFTSLIREALDHITTPDEFCNNEDFLDQVAWSQRAQTVLSEFANVEAVKVK